MATTTRAVDSTQLVDTGISFSVKLDSNLISLHEANAFLSFLNESVYASLATVCEEESSPAIVPIVELQNGSLLATIRFFVARTRDESAVALDAARDITKHVVAHILAVMIAAPAGISHDTPQQQTSQKLAECSANIIQPKFNELIQILQDSGKPYRIEVSEWRVVVEGNQVKVPPPGTGPSKPNKGNVFDKRRGGDWTLHNKKEL